MAVASFMILASAGGLYTGVTIGSAANPCGSPLDFDKSLDWEETVNGVCALRQRLASKARGHVLETAMGTGRNIPYYRMDSLLSTPVQSDFTAKPKLYQMASFTGIDISADMIDIAKHKMSERGVRIDSTSDRLQDVSRAMTQCGRDHCKVRLWQLDSQMRIPPPPLPQATAKYDTVIQSFGLCSIDDPELAIQMMVDAIKPVSGRIFLIEHGRGWPIINWWLDKKAVSHFRRYACWFNRDIEAIVREVSTRIPGLIIQSIERPMILHFGTLLWIELSVQPPEDLGKVSSSLDSR